MRLRLLWLLVALVACGRSDYDGAAFDASVDADVGTVSLVDGVVVKSIGSGAGRDFSSMQAWEEAREGALVRRSVYRVSGSSGTFTRRENVTGDQGCTGLYVPEDGAGTNGAQLSLDEADCAAGETVTGSSSGASAIVEELLATGVSERGELYADSTFVEGVTIDGSETSVDNFMWLTVAPESRHDGTAGTGAVVDPLIGGHAIEIVDSNTRIEWVEVTDWSNGPVNSVDGINVRAANVLIQNVIVHHDGHDIANTNSDADGIRLEVDGGSLRIRNSIVYSVARMGIGTQTLVNASIVIDNCTVHSCTESDNSPASYGCIQVGDGDQSYVLRNNIATGATGPAFLIDPGSTALAVEANASSDETAPDAGSVVNVEASNVFTSLVPRAEDFHLRTTVAAGINLSSEFVIDIDGDMRPAEPADWDVGADQLP